MTVLIFWAKAPGVGNRPLGDPWQEQSRRGFLFCISPVADPRIPGAPALRDGEISEAGGLLKASQERTEKLNLTTPMTVLIFWAKAPRVGNRPLGDPWQEQSRRGILVLSLSVPYVSG